MDRAAPATPRSTSRVLDQLEWPLLIAGLADYCQSEDGRERALALVPALDKPRVEERWRAVEPLKLLAIQGYKAPIGVLAPLGAVLRLAGLGQMLDGPSLRDVANLLAATSKVHSFATNFEARCSTLRRVRGQLLPLPKLEHAISRAVNEAGELRDDASDELTRIRKAKISTRRRIEETLTKLLHGDQELLPYLQDDFFTVRSERYVVPMAVDGRGRVPGTILDTSSSGQTLFLEPTAIKPNNDQLLDLEVEEKLEIARIFRELSAKVQAEHEVLKGNYQELIELDLLSAEAQLAAQLAAGPVTLMDAPGINLRDARHPLIKRSGGKAVVGNTISLTPDQSVLIISGPNAGGKTVVLKTVGLLHAMAKAGLLLPADADSSLYLYDRIYLEMGDAQNLSANLSTFSGHLMGLKPVLEHAGGRDLALLDELAVGTDPQTGAAIGTAVLEELAARRVTALVTTHFDALKGLALKDKRFRNGSMEFSLGNLSPTYKLILDLPGQSYGLEVAEQIGLPAGVLGRAKALRHGSQSNLDQAVTELMAARDAARSAEAEAQGAKLQAEQERLRWQQEMDHLKEARRKAAQQLADKYESRLSDLRSEFDELTKKLRAAAKAAPETRDAQQTDRKAAEKVLRDMEGAVNELQSGYDAGAKLPGQPATRETLAVGTPVFVLPLKKAGKVLRLGAGADETVEVEVGIIKLRVSQHDVRILSPGEAAPQASSKKPQVGAQGRGYGNPTGAGRGPAAAPTGKGNIGLTLQTPTNSVDLRGKDAMDAIQAAWNFVDRALLRGEDAVILIHGHGEGTLKAAIRDALRNNCPYDVTFRSGLDQEGGDGVTVVKLKT